MAVVLFIFVVIVVWLFLKNKQLKKKISDLSNKNEELLRSIQEFNSRMNDEDFVKNESNVKDENSSTEDENDKNKSSIPVKVSFSVDGPELNDEDLKNQNKMYEVYQKIEKMRPDFNKQFGRPFDYPAYTDKYDTGTEFKLRELLLLVWWGRVKKGRRTDARIPNYFFNTYNLNAQKVTQKFVDKGWMKVENDRYVLSQQGREAAKFYSDLWKIHMHSGFPLCLDKDFPNWNHGSLLKEFYENEVEFQHKQVDFFNKMIWFYKTYPNFSYDKENQQSNINSMENSIKNSQKDIAEYSAKVKALS